MAKRFSDDVERAIANAALRTGLDPGMIRAFVAIESGGRPNARTGSYRGALQLGADEWAKYGRQGGDIYNADDNILAGAAKLKDEMGAFKRQYGRDPSPTDLYMMHQQGQAGYGAHLSNPDAVAWQNVRPYYTDEAARARGFKDGDAYARAAIWGNVPADVRAQYPGGVESLTSRQFVDLWNNKVNRFGTQSGPVQYAAATKPDGTPQDAPQKPASEPVVASVADPGPTPQKGNNAVLPFLASMFGMNIPGATATAALGTQTPGATPGGPSLASAFGLGGANGVPLGDSGVNLSGGGDALKMVMANVSDDNKGGGEKELAAPDPLQMLGADGVTTPQVDMQRMLAVLQKRRSMGNRVV